MTAIEDIHAFWAATSSITDLIPSSSFYTGLVPPSVSLPYAALVPIASVPTFTTGDPYYEVFSFQIDLFSESATQARDIAAAVRAAFDRPNIGMGTKRRNEIFSTEIDQREAKTVYRISLVYDYFFNASQA